MKIARQLIGGFAFPDTPPNCATRRAKSSASGFSGLRPECKMLFPASLRGLEGDNRTRIMVWVMEDAAERYKQMFVPICISYRYISLRSRLVTGGPTQARFWLE